MSSKSRVISTAAVILCVIALATPASAGWPTGGVPVCTQPDTQTWPLVMSDGAGGMFITWADKRNGTHYRPYAQRYDGSGNPVWIRDGVAIGEQSLSLTMLAIISDGAYGTIIFWTAAPNEIIAQKIDANGDVQWQSAPNGVAIPVNYPELVSVVPDGIGGAVLIWQEYNSYLDVLAQRIDAGGNLMWSPTGVFVFGSATDEIEPCVIADGSGGAIVAAINGDRVRARRIYLSGNLWPTAVEVAPAGFLRQHLAMASDGAGGAFITWSREGTTTEWDIYARRMDVAGNALWPAPVPICTADEDQVHLDIIADGLGNAVIAWEDVRDNDRNIYAQKIDAFGTTLWSHDGVTVCEGFGDMYLPQLLPGSGTNVLASFVGHNIVYAQAIDGAGERVWTDLDAVYVIDVDLSRGTQVYDVNTDGAGGILAAVSDDRGIAGYDIFALPINSFGVPYRAAPELDTVVDIPGDQGGWVRLGIIRSDRDALTLIDDPVVRYDVWREIQNTALILELTATASNDDDLTRAPAPAPTGVTIIDRDDRRFIDAAPGGVFPHGLWEQLGSFSATQGGIYTYAAPTTADSSASGQADEIFIVTAHTTDPAVWFVSDEAHGYSVDNIPPHVPRNFSVAYNVNAGEENRLEWDTSPDPDFKYFRIYRDEDPGFTPSPANYVHGTTDWSWADHVAEGWRYSYKVTAVDMADNESDPAGGTVSGAGPGRLPPAVTLEQNVPNPFNPSTSISIGLPAAGHVSLVVYDITGKRVRTLVDSPLPAGFRAFAWDGRDKAGNRVSSGVYFYMLEAGGETITKKMLLLK